MREPGSTIRIATPGDVPAIAYIVARSYAVWIARIGRKPKPMLDDYKALVARGVVHGLEQDGSLRGLIVLIPQADALLLDNIAVDPDAQGRGFGAALLDFAERQARADGYSVIRLYTNVAMVENIALYVRRGYVETHRAIECDMRRVFMTKSLRRSVA